MFEIKVSESQAMIIHQLINAGLATDAHEFMTEKEIRDAHEFLKTLESIESINFENLY